MRCLFDDAGFKLSDFWGGARLDFRWLAFPVKCATSFSITSSTTSFRLALAFFLALGPAIDLWCSPDDPGTLCGVRPT